MNQRALMHLMLATIPAVDSSVPPAPMIDPNSRDATRAIALGHDAIARIKSVYTGVAPSRTAAPGEVAISRSIPENETRQQRRARERKAAKARRAW